MLCFLFDNIVAVLMIKKVFIQVPALERSGSVVECLTRDREVACSSLTGGTALCP